MGIGLDLRAESYPAPTVCSLLGRENVPQSFKGLRKGDAQGLPRLGRQCREADKSISFSLPAIYASYSASLYLSFLHTRRTRSVS